MRIVGHRAAAWTAAIGLAWCGAVGCSQIVGIRDWEPGSQAAGSLGSGAGGGGVDACADGLKSDGESDVDCGGGCEPCGIGKSCASDAHCSSEHCEDSLCCDLACDGPCRACSEEKTGADDGTCAPASADTDPDEDCDGGDVCDGAGLCRCQNGVKDGPEPSVDCAGSCTKPCDFSCMDGKQGNAETDVDCGGPLCPKCVAGSLCMVDADCAGGACARGVCQAGG